MSSNTTKVNYKTIGAKIRKLRKSKGLTQERLAEMVDVSAAYIGHIERAKKT